MHRSPLQYVVLTALLIAAPAITVSAQEAGTQAKATVAQSQSLGADVKQLTAAQMLEQAQGVLKRGQALSQSVAALLRDATKASDMIKVSCLTDKLTQIDGGVQSAEQHLGQLRSATDADGRKQQHTMVMVIGDRLSVLAQEAGQCMGKELYSPGSTTIDALIDEDMLPFENDPSMPPMLIPQSSLPTIPPAVSGMR